MIPHDENAVNAPSDAVVVWIPRNLMQACIDEASRTFPLETGGTFMGWWSNATTAVIAALIGPGPKASHGRRHFQPDQRWQLDQIAQHYEASGRRETYLGDWHTHPNASDGTLSSTDRYVLQQVISTPAARCATPLMAIYWGKPDDWRPVMWHAGAHRELPLRYRLVVREARVQPLQSSGGRAVID